MGAARALVVVGLLLAAGAGWAQAASLANVRERGTFNICAHPDALPYSSQDRTTPGFQLEIAEAIAKQLGVGLDDRADTGVAVDAARMTREDDPLHAQPDPQLPGDGLGDLELKARRGAVLARIRQRVGMRTDVERAALAHARERGGVRPPRTRGEQHADRDDERARTPQGHSSFALDSDMM